MKVFRNSNLSLQSVSECAGKEIGEKYLEHGLIIISKTVKKLGLCRIGCLPLFYKSRREILSGGRIHTTVDSIVLPASFI